MRLEGGRRRTGVVNTRHVLEEGSAAGREGGQLGSGWRQLGAGRGSWRLITAAAADSRKEQSPKTNRGHSSPASTSLSRWPPLAGCCVTWEDRGLPVSKFFLTEKQTPSIPECSWCRIGKPIHSHLSTRHPARTLGLRDETRYTEPAGVGCSRRVSLPIRRHRRRFASSPSGG